jgi:type I restriction-modification system DNA methylase subunit
VTLFGQELNAESHAICKADMLIRGQDISNIVLGNTLSDDGLLGKLFDYMLSNPPFGVEWKKIEKAIRDEYEKLGYSGRFGPGLPRVSDGSLLFLLHLLSKMRPAAQGGSRIGIVLNGSPCSPEGPARASPKSAATCWRTTWSRPSSRCPPTCSTTLASAPMCGASPTASPTTAGASCS